MGQSDGARRDGPRVGRCIPAPIAYDVALEQVIGAVTHALAVTGDARFVVLQRAVIAMRSTTQVERMERELKIA